MKKNVIDTNMLLPNHYQKIDEPFFEGKGNHSVMQLEEICEKYKEYVHQQHIVKQTIIEKFNITIVSTEHLDINQKVKQNYLESINYWINEISDGMVLLRTTEKHDDPKYDDYWVSADKIIKY